MGESRVYHGTMPTEPATVEIGASKKLPVPRNKLNAVAEQLNAIAIDERMMTVLREMGIKVEEQGILRVQHGTAYVTQHCLMRILLLITEGAKTPKQARDAAKPAGYLAGQLEKLNKAYKGTAPVVQSQEPVKQMAFPAGQPVHLTQHNYYGTVEKVEASEKDAEKPVAKDV